MTLSIFLPKWYMDEDVSESSHCDCLVRVANFSIPNKPSYCSQVLKSIQSLMDGRMLVFGKNNVCKLAIAFGAKLPVCLLVILERSLPISSTTIDLRPINFRNSNLQISLKQKTVVVSFQELLQQGNRKRFRISKSAQEQFLDL